MQIKKAGNIYWVKLERGEKIHEKLIEFLDAHQDEAPSASYTGIGAVKNTEMGFYDKGAKAYSRKMFKDEMELVSMIGNLTWVDGKPFPHTHITVSDQEYRALGGHLFEAEVAVTAEITITPFKEKVERKYDDDLCINLWNLSS